MLIVVKFPRNEGIPEVQIPFLAPSNLPYSAVTWNYSTSPQVGLDKRVLSYTRGRVLGGSSSISNLISPAPHFEASLIQRVRLSGVYARLRRRVRSLGGAYWR